MLRLPVLQTQMSRIDLWVYTRFPKNLGAWALRLVEKCAFHAALVGAVVGIVLVDFIAALAAFDAVFEDCIVEHFDDTISCMIPGLGLITIANGWSDVRI